MVMIVVFEHALAQTASNLSRPASPVCAAMGSIRVTYVERVKDLTLGARALYTEQVVGEVDILLADGDRTGERQSYWELIQQRLERAKLGTKRRVPPEYVANDPKNRGSAGATGASSQIHGKKITRMGFSMQKCADAVAISAPHDTTDLMAANRLMEELSQGLIPPLADALIVVLGSTHTTVFLRQVKGQVRCIVPEMADETGCFSRARLTEGRPVLADAVENGMFYFTLHSDVFTVWPNLQRFIHRVLNTEARGIVGEIEVMLGMCAQACAAGDAVDWSLVERDAASALPTCEGYIGTLRRYVEHNAGGPDGPLLKDLNDFVHLYEHCAQRILGGEFIEAVLKVRLPDAQLGDTVAYVKNACLKANLNGPKVVDGMCRTLLPTTLSRLNTVDMKPDVHESELLLAKARDMTSSMAHDKRVRILGMLDQRVIMYLLGKGAILGPNEVYKSVVEIAEVTLARLARTYLRTII